MNRARSVQKGRQLKHDFCDAEEISNGCIFPHAMQLCALERDGLLSIAFGQKKKRDRISQLTVAAETTSAPAALP
jgi:hypothetical protein